METENLKQILQRRKEIERDIVDMLLRAESDFAIDDIKDVIYNEENQDDLTEAISMFDTGKIFDESENILELINDAWNYFPHKVLGGISPAEKILEYEDKNNKKNFSN